MFSRSQFLAALGGPALLNLDKIEPEPKFSIDCQDVCIRDLLQMICELAEKGWQLNHNVGGFLSVKVQNSNLVDTLNAINQKLTHTFTWEIDRSGALMFDGDGFHDVREVPIHLKKFARYAGFGEYGKRKLAILELSPFVKENHPSQLGGFVIAKFDTSIYEPDRKITWFVRGFSPTNCRLADQSFDYDPLQNRRYLTLPLSSRKDVIG